MLHERHQASIKLRDGNQIRFAQARNDFWMGTGEKTQLSLLLPFLAQQHPNGKGSYEDLLSGGNEKRACSKGGASLNPYRARMRNVFFLKGSF
jgi:hypothetical protein